MKKLIAIGLALFLSACAGLPTIPKLSVNNPVTNEQLAVVISTYGLAVSGALAYKNACIKKVLAPSCRVTVDIMQSYNRDAQTAIKAVRPLVKQKSLNAWDALIAAKSAVSAFTTIVDNNRIK